MKIIYSMLFTLSILTSFSQDLKTILNENFKNNDKKWEISNKSHWKSSISNGSYNLSNNNSNSSSYFKTNNLNLRNKLFYEIETNYKVELLENNSCGGIILVNDDNLNSLLLGYLITIVKYEKDYMLGLGKSDYSDKASFKRLENFDISKFHKLKIKIDNSLPKISVFIDELLIIEENSPLFNFNEIGFFQMNKTKLKINKLIIKTSKNNNKFIYDAIDMVYDKNKNSGFFLKGNQYVTELTKYVPKAVLYDSYNFEFERFKNEILTDENCINIEFKTHKNDEKIFSFKYKSADILTLVGNENNFGENYIVFDNLENAVSFFNLFSKAKNFVKVGDKAYFPANTLKEILLNRKENSVTIHYIK